ncbi:carbohydrate sulfotransferase 11-like [Asterias rubens]|uniref:carbohydrate sulfotransferase 11-like n=1 Tax=Asterias rubens TaxID=7604 RepID=UPI0014559F62|nr:carbohydrate sulfotransferase 11-like [Asterias rubens]XP_033646658.1 carbohydrate sulfotransferase 11-like [Asterias rubens]
MKIRRKLALGVVVVLSIALFIIVDVTTLWRRRIDEYADTAELWKPFRMVDVPRSLQAQKFVLPSNMIMSGSPLEKSYNTTRKTPTQRPAPVLPEHVTEKLSPVTKKAWSAEDEFSQRMEMVQKLRHDLIHQQCRDLYNLSLLDFQKDREKILSWKTFYEHAYANDDFKFIICRVLKVGSFSWRQVIRSLYTKGSPSFKKSQPFGDYSIREYDNGRFLRDLQNYTKVLFVREPFARLLSGYRDKYVELRHFPYYKPIGSEMIKAFRKGATRAEIASGKPTFEEFLRWLVRNQEDRTGDYHWRPLFDWYHPCEIHYDYIGKLETATEDAKYIFKKIGIDKLETYPSTETHHTFSSSQDVMKKYYSQISPDLIPRLVSKHKEEFLLFNYTVPLTLSEVWTRKP